MGVLTLSLLLLGAHIVSCIAFLFGRARKHLAWFYCISLTGVWIGYWAYEKFLIDCPMTRCNIRPDLVIIYPYLLLVSLASVGGLLRHLFGKPTHQA
jgi:hypothetical protein